MKKTCFNCIYFCGSLCDPNNQTYHIHNWCKHWNTFINAYGIADKFEYNDCYYDDLETGDAFCYMFEAREKPMFEDEWFERNKRENIKNRVVESKDNQKVD